MVWYNENMEEIEVKSVSEYVEKVSEIYKDDDFVPHDEDDEYKKMLFFRGHADEDYKLLPSIFREGRKKRDEKSILDEYKCHLPRYTNIKHLDFEKDRMEILAEMQHQGIPTRLLDWSLSPLIALYFALKEESASNENDACVWVFNYWRHYEEEINNKAKEMVIKKFFDDSGKEGEKKLQDRYMEKLISEWEKAGEKNKQKQEQITEKMKKDFEKQTESFQIEKEKEFESLSREVRRQNKKNFEKFMQDSVQKGKMSFEAHMEDIMDSLQKEHEKDLDSIEEIISSAEKKESSQIEQFIETKEGKNVLKQLRNEIAVGVKNDNKNILNSYIFSIRSVSTLGRALLADIDSGSDVNHVYDTLYSMRGENRMPPKGLFSDILTCPVGFIPLYQNDRLIHQSSVFTIHGTDIKSLEEQKTQDGKPYTEKYLRKICIPYSSKKKMLEELHMLFINDYTIFPDFEGMSKQFREAGSLYHYRVQSSQI